MTRVTIHPASRSDADELIAGNCASRDYHAPWTEPFADRAGFDEWFARASTDQSYSHVVRHAQTRGVVGVFNLSQIVRGPFHSAYLGYYGMAAHARQGLMGEALRLVSAHAFGDLGLHRLEANIQPGNLASIALVRRTGFRKEGFSPRYLKIGGLWCDHERWALLADEPGA